METCSGCAGVSSTRAQHARPSSEAELRATRMVHMLVRPLQIVLVSIVGPVLLVSTVHRSKAVRLQLAAFTAVVMRLQITALAFGHGINRVRYDGLRLQF